MTRSAATCSRTRCAPPTPEGRILVIGFASGEMPQIAPNHLLVKNIDVIGFYWGGYMRFGAGHLPTASAT
jgi:NADPH2:quinone reductase